MSTNMKTVKAWIKDVLVGPRMFFDACVASIVSAIMGLFLFFKFKNLYYDDKNNVSVTQYTGPVVGLKLLLISLLF